MLLYNICLSVVDPSENNECILCKKIENNNGLQFSLHGTWDYVCEDCAVKHSPELVDLVDKAYRYENLI